MFLFLINVTGDVLPLAPLLPRTGKLLAGAAIHEKTVLDTLNRNFLSKVVLQMEQQNFIPIVVDQNMLIVVAVDISNQLGDIRRDKIKTKLI